LYIFLSPRASKHKSPNNSYIQFRYAASLHDPIRYQYHVARIAPRSIRFHKHFACFSNVSNNVNEIGIKPFLIFFSNCPSQCYCNGSHYDKESDHLVCRYFFQLKSEKNRFDANQQDVLKKLDKLRRKIIQNVQYFNKNYRVVKTRKRDKSIIFNKVNIYASIKDSVSNILNILITYLYSQPKTKQIIKGIYLRGGVGCGKTFCMNLFYESLNDRFSIQKAHFHQFMLDIHHQVYVFLMVNSVV